MQAGACILIGMLLVLAGRMGIFGQQHFWMYHLLTLILALCALPALAQQKYTLYYNSDWQLTAARDSVVYYRIATSNEHGYDVTDYFSNGRLEMQGHTTDYLARNKRQGKHTFYNADGSLKSKGSYLNNKRHGLWYDYDSLGQLKSLINYCEGRYDGELKRFFPDGKLRRIERYEGDQMVSGKLYNNTGEEIPWCPYSVATFFADGKTATLNAWIQNHLKYPQEARDIDSEGRVLVSFTVEENGQLTHLKVARSSGDKLIDAAALEIFKDMPPWTPGMLECEAVANYVVLPITFHLD